ncbi:hypothetical protein FRC04_000430 [Tulasnella sp. 424]|nr:hypothetical protein FRC04_000430 [Tulasnella sp. 424]
MLAWGIVMTLMCLVNSYTGLVIARLFPGLTESGLFPGAGPCIAMAGRTCTDPSHGAKGANFFLNLWYRRKEQAFQIALFFSATTFAGAFGGLLAAAIANGKSGLHGWQLILLIEGVITVIVSIISYFFMQDYPATAKFLTEDERAHVVEGLRRDHWHPDLATHIDKRVVWQAFKDYKAYLFTLIYICTIGAGWYSDKYHKRGPFLVGFALLDITGYAILPSLGTTSPGAGYAGAMIPALGVFITIHLAISWIGSNIGGDLKRGVVLAMVIGKHRRYLSSFIFMARESPKYYTGHGVCIEVLVITTATACFLTRNFRRLNKKKEAICAREGIGQSRSVQFREMGDDSPLFRYVM